MVHTQSTRGILERQSHTQLLPHICPRQTFADIGFVPHNYRGDEKCKKKFVLTGRDAHIQLLPKALHRAVEHSFVAIMAGTKFRLGKRGSLCRKHGAALSGITKNGVQKKVRTCAKRTAVRTSRTEHKFMDFCVAVHGANSPSRTTHIILKAFRN